MSKAAHVWVPGGTGMLGRAVCRRLSARGLAAMPTGRNVDIAQGADVHSFLEQRDNVCAIINCAAKTAVDACESEQDDAMRINAQGPQTLAEAARSLSIPIVHVSTDYVFDGNKNSAYTEDDVVAPVTVYGKSKLQGERAMWQALGETSLGYVVRTAWLFGHEGKNFVSTMLRLMRERDQVQVVSDQQGSPTFCDDLAEALVDLAVAKQGKPSPAGTYHFVNEGETSWHGLAQATWQVAKQQGASLRCQHVEPVTSEAFVRPAKRPAFSVLSTQKVTHALGRSPRTWSAALSAYLQNEVTLRQAS